VFPDQSGLAGLPRVILHAVIVVAECAVLFWMTRRVYGLFVESDAEAHRAALALQEAQSLREQLEHESRAKTLALGSTEGALAEARSAVHQAQVEEARRLEVEREAAGQQHLLLRDISSRLEGTVGTTVEVLSRSSEEMLESARRAQLVVEDTSQAVGRVKEATRISSEIILGVASATNQLSQASADIRDRMHQALEVARRAGDEAQRCDKSASVLRGAAEQVDAVMDVIERVSEQTRLLSLNAAIEAARAGHNGRGFAVVADEIRKLADTATSATREVGAVVSSMRSASNDVSAAISHIGNSVDSLTEAATTVAAAVEQQSAASHQIASSLVGAKQGTEDIRLSIERVARVNSEVTSTAENVVRSARDVAQRSVELRDRVGAVLSELVTVS
jgi:methyl-accepting chemotaxis protein